MKNNITLSLILACFLGLALSSNAQEQKLEKADEKYEQYNYVDAQKIYLAVAEKGYESEELFTKLGNSYYFNAQYDEALKWYNRLFNLNADQEPSILLRYSQTLKATANDTKAKEVYNNYLDKSKATANKTIDYPSLIAQNSGRYELQPIEALYDEDKISFGHTKVDNTLIYASTSSTQSFLNRKSAWDGLSFLSLYQIEVNEENIPSGKPSKIKGKLNSQFHESSPVFTKDGNTMYLTRNNLTADNKDNNQKLKIYRVKKEDGKWLEPEELPFNSDLYSSAHPALSPDETKLYFSSDRPGGYGSSDIYVASIKEDGSIGEAVNLGSKINTAGKETFPFISQENELYFSSDGHFGLGGMDVFYVKIQDKGYGNVLNVGAPVNTYADDFAFGIDSTTKRGFVSSNRTQTTGTFVYDNIYSFIETASIIDVFKATIDGNVTDKQTEEPIEGAAITFKDSDGNSYTTLTTDASGYFSTEINKYHKYTIRASHQNYDTDEKSSTPGLESQSVDFQLQKNKEQIISGTDLAKVLNIPMIYFDFDKANIRPDAQVELEKIVATLNEYPQLKLNIRSHTDSRGNDAYNKALSQRRATSTMDYIVSKGIDSSRLKSEGLGESELINNCSNGVKCSEAEHQKNRRSEFIIIE